MTRETKLGTTLAGSLMSIVGGFAGYKAYTGDPSAPKPEPASLVAKVEPGKMPEVSVNLPQEIPVPDIVKQDLARRAMPSAEQAKPTAVSPMSDSPANTIVIPKPAEPAAVAPRVDLGTAAIPPAGGAAIVPVPVPVPSTPAAPREGEPVALTKAEQPAPIAPPPAAMPNVAVNEPPPPLPTTPAAPVMIDPKPDTLPMPIVNTAADPKKLDVSPPPIPTPAVPEPVKELPAPVSAPAPPALPAPPVPAIPEPSKEPVPPIAMPTPPAAGPTSEIKPPPVPSSELPPPPISNVQPPPLATPTKSAPIDKPAEPSMTVLPTAPVTKSGLPETLPTGSAPTELNPTIKRGAEPTVTVIPGNSATLEPPANATAGTASTGNHFVAPQPRSNCEPKTQSYLEEQHRWATGDSYRSISERYYFTPKYDAALRQYNRDYPLASSAVRSNSAAMPAGTTIWVPPARILERDYADYIQDLKPTNAFGIVTPASRNSAVGVNPAASPSSSAAMLYRVRPGENMYEISRRTMSGSSDQWFQIYRLNPTLSNDPRLPIPAGTILRMPANALIDAADRP